MGCSVTARVKKVTQPPMGYLPIMNFITHPFHDYFELYNEESVAACWVGQAVDYITRYMYVQRVMHDGTCWVDKQTLLPVSIDEILDDILYSDDIELLRECKLMFLIHDCEDDGNPEHYRKLELDYKTIYNIKIMVGRCLDFLHEYEPVTAIGFTFGDKGCTETVDKGEGDFITDDILWDLKVSYYMPTKRYTLQVLMYYIMGLHSGYKIYQRIRTLGIYNPRTNIAYTIGVDKISKDVIKEVEEEVICYEED